MSSGTLLGDARIRIRPDMSGFESEASGRMRTIGAKLGGIAATAMKSAGVGAALAGAVGLKVAADLETARIGFETMLGSGKKADKFLRELGTFAASTPFDFAELRTAASRLTSVGVETSRIIPLMRVLGDSTAAMGTGADGINRAVMALQQMRIKGKVTGEEMLQLAEAGVPAWEALAVQLGVTTGQAQEMVSKGKVSIEDLFTAIETRQGDTLGRLTGMMDAQSQTLTGKLQNLQERFTIRMGDTMAPLVPAIKAAIDGITPVMDTGLAKVEDGFTAIVAGVDEDVVPALGRLSEKTEGSLGTMADLAKAGDWSGLGTAVGQAVNSVLDHLAGLGGKVASKLSAAVAGVDWMGVGIATGRAVVPFVVGLGLAILNGDWLMDLVTGIGDHWQVALGAVLGIALAPVKWVAKIAQLLGKIPLVGSMLAWAIKGLNGFGGQITAKIGEIAGKFGGAFIASSTKAGGFASGFKSVLETVKVSAYTWADDLGKWFTGIPSRLSAWADNWAVTLGTKAGAAWDTVTRVCGAGITRVKDTITGGITATTSWLWNTAVPWVGSAFGRLGQLVVSWITDAAPRAWTTFTEFIGSLASWLTGGGLLRMVRAVGEFSRGLFSSLWDKLRTTELGRIGSAMLDDLGHSFLNSGARVREWARTVKDKLVGSIKKFFGIHSPSTVMAGLSGHMVDGLMKGWTDNIGGFDTLAKGLSLNLPDFKSQVKSWWSSLRSSFYGGMDAASTAPPGALGTMVSNARKYLGYREGGGLFRDFQHWCQNFASDMARSAGLKPPKGASTLWAVEQFKKAGKFSKTPQVGSFAYKTRGRSGGHVGIVESILPDGRIVTIEGNVGDRVQRLTHKPGYWNLGYGVFDSGGLARGLGMMPKATLQPERVLSPRQTAAFEEWMRAYSSADKPSGHAPLVGGDLVIHEASSPEASAREIQWQLRKLRRGGAHATR